MMITRCDAAATECLLIFLLALTRSGTSDLIWPGLTSVVIVEKLVLRDPENRRFPKLDNVGSATCNIVGAFVCV